MFKTILKIAVLSATAITLLSACGAATKALNDALKDFENRARSADTQSSIDEFGYPTLRAPTTAGICSGRDIWQLWESPCDNDGASIHRRHEFCLNNPWDLRCPEDDSYDNARHESCLRYPWIRECADDDGYDDARHEYCLNNLWDSECADGDSYDDARHEYCVSSPFDYYCQEDDRYQNARLESCAIDFSVECVDGGFAKDGLEVYSQRIKFCNNPANAGHSFCVDPSEPQVDSEGHTHSQFLQGTADGLNTGSLRASILDETATAPVVHILKLSDSDDGVAFFSGVAPDTGQEGFILPSYYAGILPDPNLGAPITQKSGTAVWQGTFSVLETSIRAGRIRFDTDFDLEIDFAEKQLSAFIYGGAWIDSSYHLISGYRLLGAFSDGKIEGDLHVTYEFRNYGVIWEEEARVRGLIGQEGAIGAFISYSHTNSYAGGFVARPPSE